MGTAGEAKGRALIVSPEDQRVTFVELFFDLVFVFSVTRVVGFLHHHLDWIGVGQTLLLFWLVWWAWTQFTWALNAADTNHSEVRLLTLLATGVAFFMAVSLPKAFYGGAAWFALPYVVVRLIGLGLYIRVSLVSSAAHRTAVRTFALLSLGGLAAVLGGGFAGGSTIYWLWGLAILLDVIAALVGGETGDWNLHPEHFAERHGLFVIIALGESLIVAAGGLSGSEVGPSLLLVGALAVIAVGALWWSYFGTAKSQLDRALEEARDTARATLARDAFTLVHFLMILGVIGFAAGVEGAVLYPSEPFHLEDRMAVGLGVLLFAGGMGLAIRRATGKLPLPRMVLTFATAGLAVGLGGFPPSATLGVAAGGMILLALYEQRRPSPLRSRG